MARNKTGFWDFMKWLIGVGAGLSIILYLIAYLFGYRRKRK